MSLESATYIDGLVASNPPGDDPRSQGDDHLRLVKSVLKNTFPNASGAINLKPAANTLTLGVGAEDALQIDATAKTVKALSPYSIGSNGPAFRANIGTVRNPTPGVYQALQGWTEQLDSTGAFNPTTGVFQPAVAGYYQVTLSLLYVNTNAVHNSGIATVYKNGAEDIWSLAALSDYASARNTAVATGIVYLNGTTDQLAPYCYVDVVATINNVAQRSLFAASMVRGGGP